MHWKSVQLTVSASSFCFLTCFLPAASSLAPGGWPGPRAPAGASPAGSLHASVTISQHSPQTKQAGAPPAPKVNIANDPVLIFNHGPRQPSVPSATLPRPRCHGPAVPLSGCTEPGLPRGDVEQEPLSKRPPHCCPSARLPPAPPGFPHCAGDDAWEQ